MPGFHQSASPSGAALDRAKDDADRICMSLPAALGPGRHRLDLVVDWDDDTFGQAEGVVGEGAVHGTGGTGAKTAGDLADVRFLLVSALLGGRVRSAVLVARTGATCTRVCGWRVRRGWVEPLDPRTLRLAVTPCPGVPAVPGKVSRAPFIGRDGARARWPAGFAASLRSAVTCCWLRRRP